MSKVERFVTGEDDECSMPAPLLGKIRDIILSWLQLALAT